MGEKYTYRQSLLFLPENCLLKNVTSRVDHFDFVQDTIYSLVVQAKLSESAQTAYLADIDAQTIEDSDGGGRYPVGSSGSIRLA